MGGNALGGQITQGLQRARMQNNPMPPGQQGPPNPMGMIPEFKFDPEKGLNVTLNPQMLQQLLTAGMGLMKQQGPQGVPQPGQQMGMGQQQPPPGMQPPRSM